MTTQTKHTATPWEYDEVETSCGRCFRIGSREQLDAPHKSRIVPSCACLYDDYGSGENTTKANAAFIVRAVNAHDELVAALEFVRPYVLEHERRNLCEMGSGTTYSDKIDAALAKAHGEA